MGSGLDDSGSDATVIAGAFGEGLNLLENALFSTGFTGYGYGRFTDSGAAHVYTYNPIENIWEYVLYLKAPNAGSQDFFGGHAVQVKDGVILVSAVGVDSDGINSYPDVGAIYHFE